MNITKTIGLAFSSILSNKMRSFLTMLGIIIGVAAVIILVSIMDGITGQVSDAFESFWYEQHHSFNHITWQHKICRA